MAERCIKGDYIGFTFGGVHSSELGLMRVSDGSRYNQDLLPPLQDKTAQVNGRDGAVYFGSQYNTRPIKVPVAFDNMTEENFNQLKRLLQDKKPKYLWFDETPYKQWLVKAANAQSFKWICFDESHNGKEKRIYKGEGTLEFSCFSPYAESRVTFLDDEVDQVIYRYNKKLYFGDTPYLEIFNVEGNGILNRELFYSSFLKNQDPTDDIFVIENYPTLKPVFTTKTEKDKNGNDVTVYEYTIDGFSDFIQKGEENGYMTFVETDLPELSAVPAGEAAAGFIISESYGFSGRSIDNSFNGIYRIYLISEADLDELDSFILGTEELLTIKAYTYGYRDKKISNIYIRKSADGTNYFYKEHNFSLSSNSTGSGRYPTILICQGKAGQTYLLRPKYNDQFILIGYEKDFTTKLKVVTIKGYSKDSNNQYVSQKRLLEDNYNFQEWCYSSNLRHSTSLNDIVYDKISKKGKINVYNAGDIPTDIKLIYSSRPSADFSLALYSFDDQDNPIGEISFEKFSFQGEDNGFIIDSKLKLIKGTKNGKPTGNVYNKYQKSGDFFKIPVCDDDEYYIIKSSSESYNFSVEYKHHYI